MATATVHNYIMHGIPAPDVPWTPLGLRVSGPRPVGPVQTVAKYGHAGRAQLSAEGLRGSGNASQAPVGRFVPAPPFCIRDVGPRPILSWADSPIRPACWIWDLPYYPSLVLGLSRSVAVGLRRMPWLSFGQWVRVRDRGLSHQCFWYLSQCGRRAKLQGSPTRMVVTWFYRL